MPATHEALRKWQGEQQHEIAEERLRDLVFHCEGNSVMVSRLVSVFSIQIFVNFEKKENRLSIAFV